MKTKIKKYVAVGVSGLIVFFAGGLVMSNDLQDIYEKEVENQRIADQNVKHYAEQVIKWQKILEVSQANVLRIEELAKTQGYELRKSTASADSPVSPQTTVKTEPVASVQPPKQSNTPSEVKVAVIAKKPCVKKNVGEDQQQWVRIASEISGNDLDFLATLEAENGLWSPFRQSDYVKNGVREPSYGFCQIHKGYHPEIVNDPRFFTDARWQLEQCWRLYKGGTKFYGKNNISKTKSRFVCE